MRVFQTITVKTLKLCGIKKIATSVHDCYEKLLRDLEHSRVYANLLLKFRAYLISAVSL